MLVSVKDALVFEVYTYPSHSPSDVCWGPGTSLPPGVLAHASLLHLHEGIYRYLSSVFYSAVERSQVPAKIGAWSCKRHAEEEIILPKVDPLANNHAMRMIESTSR